MRNVLYLLILLSIGIFQQSCLKNDEPGKEVVCQFTIETVDFDRTGSVVSVALDDITSASDTNLVLYKIVDNNRIQTPVQFEFLGDKRYMYWILTDAPLKGSKRQYELVLEKSNPQIHQPPISILNQNGEYEFAFNGRRVLKYNSQIVQPPEGIDESYKRSGFINPLYAPNQAILTRIPDSTSDHLHHYGLWNAWKKVLFKGDTIDFFAPQFGQGTVRHVGEVSKNEGPVFSSLQVLREHITWQNTEKRNNSHF